MRHLIRASMGLVALAAFTLSFQTLTQLAELAGYGQLSWLYPVTLDLGTVASCSAWMTTKSRQAFHLTWALLTGSILLNGVEHWLVATGQRPAWWLITVIAMAPPAILGVVTHLAVGLGKPGRPATSRVRQPTRSTPTTPEFPTNAQVSVQEGTSNVTCVTSTSADRVAAVGGTDTRPEAYVRGADACSEPSLHDRDLASAVDDLGGIDPVAELIEAGAGRRRIAAELGLTEHKARQLLAERRNGHGGADVSA